MKIIYDIQIGHACDHHVKKKNSNSLEGKTFGNSMTTSQSASNENLTRWKLKPMGIQTKNLWPKLHACM